jgi:hypothetical protein
MRRRVLARTEMTAKLASVPISRYRKMNGVEFAGMLYLVCGAAQPERSAARVLETNAAALHKKYALPRE